MGTRFVAVLTVGLGLSLAVPRAGHAQIFSPYSDFQAMTVSQISTLQVKLAYVADVGPPAQSILFAASQSSVNVALFTPYRRPSFTYRGDELDEDSFITTAQTLKTMIDSVATLSGVTDGNVDPGGYVSFALLNTVGGTKAFEAIVDSTNGPALFGKLLQVFASDAAARNTIRGFGCGLGMLPRSALTNVTSSTTVTASGLRLDRTSSQYVGKVRVTNTSGSAINAPLILTVKANGDMSVAEADGQACNIGDPGSFYVTLLGTGSLGPGANIEKTLHITNPGEIKLHVSFKVYAGAGTP